MDLHFKSMAEVLLDDSAPLVGKSLKYLHDDSWEVGLPNWTRGFLDEFQKYRGYDARPYLPALAGHAVGSPEISDRFLYDLRKTIADCLAENHYARFADLARTRGVGIHPEAGGPCWPKVVPMDAQEPGALRHPDGRVLAVSPLARRARPEHQRQADGHCGPHLRQTLGDGRGLHQHRTALGRRPGRTQTDGRHRPLRRHQPVRASHRDQHASRGRPAGL